MNKAQELRRKRLNNQIEALQEKKRRMEASAKVKEDTEKMINFIFDLLENPTPHNSEEEVILIDSPKHQVKIGSYSNNEETDFKFDVEVMLNVVEKFRKEDGYLATFNHGDGEEIPSQVVIKMFV